MANVHTRHADEGMDAAQVRGENRGAEYLCFGDHISIGFNNCHLGNFEKGRLMVVDWEKGEKLSNVAFVFI